MRPFDEMPVEEADYSDVALMVAGVREWPTEEFARDLDARVARRFAPEAAGAGGGYGVARVALPVAGCPAGAAGPAVGRGGCRVAAVIVVSGGGPAQPRHRYNPSRGPGRQGAADRPRVRDARTLGCRLERRPEGERRRPASPAPHYAALRHPGVNATPRRRSPPAASRSSRRRSA